MAELNTNAGASGAPRWTLAELATIAGDMARLEHQLFVTLGVAARAADPPHPPDLLATWCHRHAWHVELWEQRAPVVAGWFGADPPSAWPAAAAIDQAIAALTGSDQQDLAATVATAIESLAQILATIAERLDPVFDPASARVVLLVRRDVAEQLAALSGSPDRSG